MSSLHEYLLGQIVQTTRSIESAHAETDKKIDSLTERVDGALTWAQRLIWIFLSLMGALGLNYSPDKIGEALSAALKALR